MTKATHPLEEASMTNYDRAMATARCGTWRSVNFGLLTAQGWALQVQLESLPRP
jgi:hypothetical protein